jgi:hypothetical protein
MYDAVAQYGQVLGGPIDDWHPPIMVRLWQLLHPLASGTAPMFALQVTLYAAGFSLIAGAVAKVGRWRAAIATIVLTVSPLLLGWQMVVLKDAQMLGALLCAVGIVAHYRLANRRMPAIAVAVTAVLIAYATLVRANAFITTVPLSVLLMPTRTRPALTLGIAIAAGAAVLGLTPIVNHRLLGAEPSDVAKALPLFDLAAIAVAAPASPSPFAPEERAQIIERHCVKAFFWDPLGDPSGCSSATERLMEVPAGELSKDLAAAAARHPIAYAQHRFAHWNSTERWLVAPGLPDAAPPVEAEPNDLGLVTPSNPIAAAWQDVAAAEAATPLGWPIVWTVVAVFALLPARRRRGDPAGGLALALLASALALELSFLAISIASDLRYHLWPMAASALALVLLSDDLRLRRREWIAAGAVLAFVVAAGVFERSTLPRAPDSYEGMIHAATG